MNERTPILSVNTSASKDYLDESFVEHNSSIRKTGHPTRRDDSYRTFHTSLEELIELDEGEKSSRSIHYIYDPSKYPRPLKEFQKQVYQWETKKRFVGIGWDYEASNFNCHFYPSILTVCRAITLSKKHKKRIFKMMNSETKTPSSNLKKQEIPSDPFWIDLQSPDYEEITYLGHYLKLHEITIEDIHCGDCGEKFEIFEKYIYINYSSKVSKKNRHFHTHRNFLQSILPHNHPHKQYEHRNHKNSKFSSTKTAFKKPLFPLIPGNESGSVFKFEEIEEERLEKKKKSKRIKRRRKKKNRRKKKRSSINPNRNQRHQFHQNTSYTSKFQKEYNKKKSPFYVNLNIVIFDYVMITIHFEEIDEFEMVLKRLEGEFLTPMHPYTMSDYSERINFDSKKMKYNPDRMHKKFSFIIEKKKKWRGKDKWKGKKKWKAMNKVNPFYEKSVVERIENDDFHYTDTKEIEKLEKAKNKNENKKLVTITWIVYALLDATIDLMDPDILKNAKKVEDGYDRILDMKLEETIKLDVLRYIRKMNKDLEFQKRQLFGKRKIIERILLNRNKYFRKNNFFFRNLSSNNQQNLVYYRHIRSHILQTLAELNDSKETLTHSHSNYLMMVSFETYLFHKKIDDFLNRLTILGVILIPFEATGPIWGMNMPCPGAADGVYVTYPNNNYRSLYWFYGLLVMMTITSLLVTVFFMPNLVELKTLIRFYMFFVKDYMGLRYLVNYILAKTWTFLGNKKSSSSLKEKKIKSPIHLD